ncbi:MAG: FAD-dependent monooxygenase, partial [Rhodospirillales bacterium]|nr:FAD-dependent monooxygenase [Rhodospirillales bacterium]
MAASLRKVLIAGGGIGGVATALCLKRLGVPFLLLEQAAAFGEIGAGIQLSPNVTRLLARLGVGDE